MYELEVDVCVDCDDDDGSIDDGTDDDDGSTDDVTVEADVTSCCVEDATINPGILSVLFILSTSKSSIP